MCFQTKMKNSDKMEQFFGWIFGNYFAAEFNRLFIGVRLSEFSKEIQRPFQPLWWVLYELGYSRSKFLILVIAL